MRLNLQSAKKSYLEIILNHVRKKRNKKKQFQTLKKVVIVTPVQEEQRKQRDSLGFPFSKKNQRASFGCPPPLSALILYSLGFQNSLLCLNHR